MSGGAVLYHEDFLQHGSASHVERPDRLRAIREALTASPVDQAVEHIEVRAATDAEIERVHPPGFAEHLDAFCREGGGWIDSDTVLSPDSARVARLSAGAAVRGAEAVMQEGARWVFSICRPPGHHATPSTSMGFCLLNNAAIAARHAQQKLGAKRILIVDWDVHHGNGTQDIFYPDGSVMYFSIHQSPLYPGTGFVAELGDGGGKGTTVNVPLPAGMGDAEYQYVFHHVLRPAAVAYKPDLVIVSAGFDAHTLDPLGGMNVTTQGFAHLADMVRDIAQDTPAQGRILAVLEGGYDLKGLSDSVVAVMQRWNEDRLGGDDLHLDMEHIHPAALHVVKLHQSSGGASVG